MSLEGYQNTLGISLETLSDVIIPYYKQMYLHTLGVFTQTGKQWGTTYVNQTSLFSHVKIKEITLQPLCECLNQP